jgi:hypothetical protein
MLDHVTSGWGDVEQGRRELGWDVLFGEPEEAAYLSPLGREVARRAMDGLSEFFGPGWLTQAANQTKSQDRIDLMALSPSIFGPSQEQRRAFLRLLGLWTSLQVLVDSHAEGIGALRRTMRSNPARIEFRHAVAQARLAAQAQLVGARVTLEPAKPDKTPGDVRAVRGGAEVFLEYRGMDADMRSTRHAARMEQASVYLLHGGGGHAVTWSGELPLDPDDEWYRRVQQASEQCARTGAPVEVATDGAVLRCTPGDAHAAGEGRGTIVWPRFDRDQQHRFMRALDAKAEQTRAAGAAWIWLEDGGALWPRTPFAASSLSEKIDTLVDLLDRYFPEHPHVLGVVLTSGEPGPVPQGEASVRHPRGAGFVRELPSGQLRESVVVRRRLDVPGQFELVSQLCTTEPSWLGHALVRLLPPHLLLSVSSEALGHVGECGLAGWPLFA